MAFQSFSESLKERMMKYALEKYGRQITPEEAEEYLRSLGKVYLTFYEVEKRNRRGKKSRKI